MAERLSFNRLVLTGPGRNYEISFQPGLNLISGPIWTGKSSVLQLLDYCCGAKRPPTYPEISKCSDVYVECVVGGEILSIRRSLKSASAKSIIYRGVLSSVLDGSMAGTEVMARHVKGSPSTSSELLARLGLANIEVKTAPTQEASDLSAFSIRDLLLIFYVDQDRMGSAKSGFFEEQPPKAIKWKAAVEIVHGLYDEASAQLSQALREAETEEHRILQYLRNAREFLDDFRIHSVEDLENKLESLSLQRREIEGRLHDVRRAADDRLGADLELVRRRGGLEGEREAAATRAGELRRTLSQLGRLRVQYDRERAQLEFLGESESLVGNLPVVRCPACLQPIDPKPDASSCYVCHRTLPTREGEISVEARLRSTRRRISDLEGYIAEVEEAAAELDKRASTLGSQIKRVDVALRRTRAASTLPETDEVLSAMQALALVDEEERQTTEHLDLRRKAQGEGSNLLAVAERVQRLRAEVARAEASRPSRQHVVQALSEGFIKTLSDVRFPEMADSRLDEETFLPFVRGQVYGRLSSKGAISLAIVAWHIALLRYSLEQGSRFPRVLLLDSPLSHVGHDATDEQFKDQQIVEAFYSLLLQLHEKWKSEFQMIVVDNRAPSAARGLVVANFTRDPTTGRFGLIDDEHPSLPDANTNGPSPV